MADFGSDAAGDGQAPISPSLQRRHERIKAALTGFSSRSRRLISEHRQKRRSGDREVSDRSRRGLDWMNFFMADVQVGFGSFLAFYLAGLGWSKEDVGFALSVGGLTGIIVLVPAGALVDALRGKRGLVATGILAIAASALILAFRPSFWGVVGAEMLHGATAGVVGPAIAAISLGLAGRHGMSLRVGRNFRFASAGNALTAAAMGVLGGYVSSNAIFLTTVVLCVPALIALASIRGDEIDYARARNAAKSGDTFKLQRITDLGRNRNLYIFAFCLMIFQFSNASLLPLVSQNLGQSKEAASALYMAGMIVVPQLVFTLLAPWVGYWSELQGRKPLLLIGFATDALRACIYIFVADPRLMLAVQLLDGVTSSLVTVLTVLVITDLTAGTGRFNLAQGVVGVLTGLSATLSTPITGMVVQHLGDLAGFLVMAATSLIGMAVLWALLPESRPAGYDD